MMNQERKLLSISACMATIMLLSACRPSQAELDAAATQAALEAYATQTAKAPTATMTPTNTPIPTNTPLPPTKTPKPTATPLPPTSTPAPTASRPEARGGVIAFVMAQSGWGGIHVIQADGSSNPIMLSGHPRVDIHPSWSPDGSQIAFEANREDPNDQEHMYIYIINSDGSQLTRITDADAVYRMPDWSPDGSRIAMVSDKQEPGNTDLYVMDLNTRKLTRLTDDPAMDAEPSWSPDGSQIAFASNRDDWPNVYILEVDTGETTQLTQGSGFNAQPDWSPDGKKILFASKRDGDVEIYVMDADGANQVRLTTTPGDDIHPAWSPDGSYFAYAHEEAEGRTIYVSDLNGSPPELLFELPEGATAGHPAWTFAQETISQDPVIGPPFCMRDTDGDFQPDTVSTTFTTEDDFGFIVFPYDNMQDGMTFSHSWETPGELSMVGENIDFWDGGKQGMHISYSTLQHTPGVVTVKLYLEDKFLQEIKCVVVQPSLTEDHPNTLHVASFVPDPSDLDPALQTGSADDYVGAIYAGLVRLSPELEVVPALAENWKISPDGKVYTFTLRKGLAFGNGKPITADDFRYSWERAADPVIESPTALTYLGDIAGVKDKLDGKAEHISGLEVLDERTLQVTLEGPRPEFLLKLSYPTSFVVDKEFIDRVDGALPNASGPYSIVDSDMDDHLTLERNEFYYQPADIDRIEYSYSNQLPTYDIPGYFEAGYLDITTLRYIEDINSVLKSDHPVHDNLVIGIDQCTDLVEMNSALPPLDDINLRKALALTIDRDRLNDELSGNLDLPAFTILPPGMPGYLETLASEQSTQTGYNPEAAIKALAASRYAERVPAIRMGIFSNEDSANLLASNWQQTLGISVDIDPLDRGDLDDATINKRYHLLLHGWCADYPDPANYLDVLYSGDSDYNGFIIQDPLINKPLEQARSELDNAKRITLYQDIERRLLEEFLSVPLMHPRMYILVSSNVDGFIYPGIDVRYLDQLTLKK